MEIYSNVFNKAAIYNTLFLKIFTVTEHADVEEFRENGGEKYWVWREKVYRAGVDIDKVESMDKAYRDEWATPEYAKIVGVTFCTVNNKDGEMKRNFQNIYNENDEATVLRESFSVFNELNKLATPLMCGHNILGYDIPFLVKRGMKHGLQTPEVLKKAINSKPWESIAIDTVILWKFGGNGYSSLNEIATFAGLKYKELPMHERDMNGCFHSLESYVNDEEWYQKETMNRVNLMLQLIVKLRGM